MKIPSPKPLLSKASLAFRKYLQEANAQCSNGANKLLNRCNIANSHDFNRLNRSVSDLATRIEQLADREGLQGIVLERRQQERRTLEPKAQTPLHENRLRERRHDPSLHR